MQNIAPKKACNQMSYLGKMGQSGEEKPCVRSESGGYCGASRWRPAAALVDTGPFLAPERRQHVPSASQRQTKPRRRAACQYTVLRFRTTETAGALVWKAESITPVRTSERR